AKDKKTIQSLPGWLKQLPPDADRAINLLKERMAELNKQYTKAGRLANRNAWKVADQDMYDWFEDQLTVNRDKAQQALNRQSRGMSGIGSELTISGVLGGRGFDIHREYRNYVLPILERHELLEGHQGSPQAKAPVATVDPEESDVSFEMSDEEESGEGETKEGEREAAPLSKAEREAERERERGLKVHVDRYMYTLMRHKYIE
ncbi:hypothetical protein KIPB_010325, partial [Kipferlia bialata]